MRATSDGLAGTAHDLANVIAVIAGSAAMLTDDLADLPADHPARENMERLALATRRAAELCERLRPDARPAAARTGASLDLSAATSEGIGLVRPAIERDRSVRCTVAERLPVRVASLDVLQVALNLCLNARAATAPGGSIAVSVDRWVADRGEALIGRLVPGRSYARLSVEDDGHGVAPERARALFEPGATTSADANRGHGLAVVASIAEQTCAAIRVGAGPTGGACFEVMWPLVETGPPDLTGRAILLVGGGPRETTRIADAAEAAGADVSLCLDPEDAVASVAEDCGVWDAVVVGALRRTDPAALIARIGDADPSLPVLALSDRPVAGARTMAPDQAGAPLVTMLAASFATCAEAGDAA